MNALKQRTNWRHTLKSVIMILSPSQMIDATARDEFWVLWTLYKHTLYVPNLRLYTMSAAGPSHLFASFTLSKFSTSNSMNIRSRQSSLRSVIFVVCINWSSVFSDGECWAAVLSTFLCLYFGCDDLWRVFILIWADLRCDLRNWHRKWNNNLNRSKISTFFNRKFKLIITFVRNSIENALDCDTAVNRMTAV